MYPWKARGDEWTIVIIQARSLLPPAQAKFIGGSVSSILFFTVIHIEWASDSNYENDDDDDTFHMDTILISTKDLLYDAKYAAHIFISAHSTFRTKLTYNDINIFAYFQPWARVVECKYWFFS